MAKAKKPSAEDRFADAWAEHGFPGSDITRQYQIGEGGWLYDFAFPSLKLAIEINGFGFGHQAQQSQARDAEKSRWAVLSGWRVLTFTTRCIQTQAGLSRAIHDVCDAMQLPAAAAAESEAK